MLVNCNSCQKKFTVPDSAITEKGRLLQCGSCNYKWTQFPFKEKFQEQTDIPDTVIRRKPSKKKKETPGKKKEIQMYTEAYLKKKHGLSIKEGYENKNNKKKKNNQLKSGFGFYSYLIIIIIFFLTIFGILHLAKDIIIFKYPATESSINYFFEVVDIIKTIINELVN